VRLIADTLGPMMPTTCFDGSVHSIFERLVNVKLEDESFISICRKDVSNGPGIIRCQLNNKFNFEDYTNTGEICAIRGGVLRIGPNFQVDLRSARRWKRRIGISNTRRITNRWSIYLDYVYKSKGFDRVNHIIGNPYQYLEDNLNMEENY